MGRMRIELALIVGIVFFCCWCIYIIIKMNSSVSLSPQSLVPRDTSTADSYLIRQHAASSPIPRQIVSPTNESYMNLARHTHQQPAGYPVTYQQQPQQQAPMRHQSQTSNQQPQRQPYSPAHSFSGWPTARLPASGPPIADHIGGASTWRDYSSVSALQQPAAVAALQQQQQHRWQPQINFQHAQQQPVLDPDSQVIRASNFTPTSYFRPAIGQPASQINWRPVNGANPYKNNNNNNVYGRRLVGLQDLDPDSETEPADAQVDQNGNEAGGGEQAASDDESPTIAGNTELPDEEEPDNVNRELEEQTGSRSFSEDDDESNERDKNGNLIISHRKHLINGKPVRDDNAQRSSSKRKRKQVVDFDKLVNEIEGDEQENEFDDDPDNVKRQPVGKSSSHQQRQQHHQQTDESRPRKIIQSVNMSPRWINDSTVQPYSPNETKAIDLTRWNNANRAIRAKSKQKRVVNSDRKPKAGERELHEHRLHESLTAQQWDDDAASAPETKNNSLPNSNISSTPAHLPAGNSSQPKEQDGKDDDPETGSEEGKVVEEEKGQGQGQEEENGLEKVEEEDDPSGPQQVEEELKEMDMFADPEQFMKDDSADERRRRRRRKKRRRKRQVHGVESMQSRSPIKQPVNAAQADWNTIKRIINNGTISGKVDEQLVLSDNGILEAGFVRLIDLPEPAASERTIITAYPKLLSHGPPSLSADLITNFHGNVTEDDDDDIDKKENSRDQMAIASEMVAKVLSGRELKASAEPLNELKFREGGDGTMEGFNKSLQAPLHPETSLAADDSMKASESKSGRPLLFDGANINKDNDHNHATQTNNETRKHTKLGLGLASGFDSDSDFDKERWLSSGSFASAKIRSEGLSRVDEKPSASALSHSSTAPTEAALRSREKMSSIERGETVGLDAKQQPESKEREAQVDEEVVSGEDDMSFGVLAKAPYLMSAEPPALNASAVQYSDVPQAPAMANRPQRELGPGYAAVYPLAPSDDEQTPHSQEAQLPYSSHHQDTPPPTPISTYYNSPTSIGYPADPVNQAAFQKQSDEPPFEVYHGMGGLQAQPLERPPSSDGVVYLSDGASNGLFGGVGVTDHNDSNHLASASKLMKKKKMTKKKKAKKFNKSMMSDSKLEKAKAISMKKRSKFKKGKMKKKKKKFKDKAYKIDKEFKGDKKGKKGKKGQGEKGANKGALFYKDKGYKKRGFKKAYKKLEEGDHKTYFDEFRDKDHNKKWKRFKDKHHYNQKKNWTGKDRKKFKNYHEDLFKDKKEKEAAWREKAASKHKKVHKYRGDSSRFSKKKKVKKENSKKKSKDYI